MHKRSSYEYRNFKPIALQLLKHLIQNVAKWFTHIINNVCNEDITIMFSYNWKFQADHVNSWSKKGKTPWMTYNNEEVADSQFCIEYLNKKLRKYI